MPLYVAEHIMHAGEPLPHVHSWGFRNWVLSTLINVPACLGYSCPDQSYGLILSDLNWSAWLEKKKRYVQLPKAAWILDCDQTPIWNIFIWEFGAMYMYNNCIQQWWCKILCWVNMYTGRIGDKTYNNNNNNNFMYNNEQSNISVSSLCMCELL